MLNNMFQFGACAVPCNCPLFPWARQHRASRQVNGDATYPPDIGDGGIIYPRGPYEPWVTQTITRAEVSMAMSSHFFTSSPTSAMSSQERLREGTMERRYRHRIDPQLAVTRCSPYFQGNGHRRRISVAGQLSRSTNLHCSRGIISELMN